jgi:hypothetical protein
MEYEKEEREKMRGEEKKGKGGDEQDMKEE